MLSFLKSKKFLIVSGLSLISIVALSAGLGVGLNNKQINNTTQLITDPSILLQETIKQINESDIEFKVLSSNKNPNIQRKNKTEINANVNKSTTYAFEIKKEQIHLKNSKKISNELDLEFEIKLLKNKAKELNKGNLKVDVKLVHKKTNQQESKTLMFSGFKKAEVIKKDFFKQGSDTEIVFLPTKNGIQNSGLTPYNTIESLNKQIWDGTRNVLGLVAWMKQTVEKTANKERFNNINIEGQLKLDRIGKENNQTVFYLTSADETKPLVLVSYENGKELRTTLEEIKTNNLLATDLTVVPLNTDIQSSKQLNEALKSVAAEKSKQYLNDEVDENLNWDLSINLSDLDANSTEVKVDKNKVFIKPYSVHKKQLNSSKIKVGFKLSYGREETAKIFDTSIPADLEQLTNAGINFNFFTNTIKTQPKKLDANLLKNELKNAYEVLTSEVSSSADSKYINLVLTTENKEENGVLTYPIKKEEFIKNHTLGNNSLFEKDIRWTNLKDVETKLIEFANKQEMMQKTKATKEINDDLSNNTYVLAGTYSYAEMDNNTEALMSPIFSLIEIK